MERYSCSVAKTTWEENKIGSFTLPDTKSYWVAMTINTVALGGSVG